MSLQPSRRAVLAGLASLSGLYLPQGGRSPAAASQ
jgi:hypothetical protein